MYVPPGFICSQSSVYRFFYIHFFFLIVITLYNNNKKKSKRFCSWRYYYVYIFSEIVGFFLLIFFLVRIRFFTPLYYLLSGRSLLMLLFFLLVDFTLLLTFLKDDMRLCGTSDIRATVWARKYLNNKQNQKGRRFVIKIQTDIILLFNDHIYIYSDRTIYQAQSVDLLNDYAWMHVHIVYMSG